MEQDQVVANINKPETSKALVTMFRLSNIFSPEELLFPGYATPMRGKAGNKTTVGDP